MKIFLSCLLILPSLLAGCHKSTDKDEARTQLEKSLKSATEAYLAAEERLKSERSDRESQIALTEEKELAKSRMERIKEKLKAFGDH